MGLLPSGSLKCWKCVSVGVFAVPQCCSRGQGGGHMCVLMPTPTQGPSIQQRVVLRPQRSQTGKQVHWANKVMASALGATGRCWGLDVEGTVVWCPLPVLPVSEGRIAVQSLSRVQLTDCSTPGLPILHCLKEFAQTHVHWVDDAIQPSHPLSSPSPPAFEHRGLFCWIGSSHQVAKVLELQLQHRPFQWIFRVDFL